MKKNLLLLAAAMAAVSLTAQAEVQYELICVGTRTDGTASKYNTDGKKLGQGVIMTYNTSSKCYECELKEINVSSAGFKIISDDQDKVSAVKAAGLSGANLWHTQWGIPHTGGTISLASDAEPTILVDFLHSVGDKGYTPADISFAGGVAKVKDAKVYFWPDNGYIMITGTPTEYKSFQIFKCEVDNEGITSKADWALNLTADPENAGIYTGVYDFGTEEGIKYFDIRSTKSQPVYGFSKADDSNVPFRESVTRSGEITQKLNAYATAKLDHRASFSAAVQKGFYYKPAAADLTGKYNVRFDSNTGELTLTQDAGIESGVEVMVVETEAPVEYFNMQGMRVENPENGVFIRRQGNKATKVRVK